MFTCGPALMLPIVVGGGTPKISTLIDNFATNDAAKWTLTTTGAGPTYAVTSGQGVVTLADSVAGTNTAGIISNIAYDLAASRFFLRYAQSSSTANGTNVADSFRLQTDASNWIRFSRTGTSITADKDVAASITQLATATYASATHAWLSIRESGGTITFETAPSTASNPPIAGDWVTFATTTVAGMGGSFNLASVFARLTASTFASVTSTGVCKFDGVNGAT